VWYPSSSLSGLNFTCGLPAGNDNPTNTAANADSPEGTHDPYGGSTYTPGPRPASHGMGIAGYNHLSRRSHISVDDHRWTKEVLAVTWALAGGLLVWML
jgi:hypothetical protein